MLQQVQSQTRPQAIFTSFKLEKGSPIASDHMATHLKSPSNQTTPENVHIDGSASKDSCGSTNNNGSDRKRRLSFSSSPSNDSEKVSIVRAAGTFFPQNCDDDLDSSTSSGRAKSKNTSASELIVPTATAKKCRIAACNLSNDVHVHCAECPEVRKPSPVSLLEKRRAQQMRTSSSAANFCFFFPVTK